MTGEATIKKSETFLSPLFTPKCSKWHETLLCIGSLDSRGVALCNLVSVALSKRQILLDEIGIERRQNAMKDRRTFLKEVSLMSIALPLGVTEGAVIEDRADKTPQVVQRFEVPSERLNRF